MLITSSSPSAELISIQAPAVSFDIKGLLPFVIKSVTAIETKIPKSKPTKTPFVKGVPSAFFACLVL